MKLKENAELLTRTYLSYLDEDTLQFMNTATTIELFRHSLCLALELKSKEADIFIADKANEVSRILVDKVEEMDGKFTDADKHGVLEACIHILELTMQKAGI